MLFSLMPGLIFIPTENLPSSFHAVTRTLFSFSFGIGSYSIVSNSRQSSCLSLPNASPIKYVNDVDHITAFIIFINDPNRMKQHLLVGWFVPQQCRAWVLWPLAGQVSLPLCYLWSLGHSERYAVYLWTHVLLNVPFWIDYLIWGCFLYVPWMFILCSQEALLPP